LPDFTGRRIVLVIIGAVLALNRPRVRLRTTGLVLRDAEIPWRDITGARTVDGFRTRSVQADHGPQRCDLAPATARRLGVAVEATDIESPLMPRARACLRRGDDRVLAKEVEVYHRSWLNAGVSRAAVVYSLWRVDAGVAPSEEGPAPRPGPLPADDVSSTGYTPDMREPIEGVYLVARRANVVVVIAFSPDHAMVPALLNRDVVRTHYTPGTYRPNARPADLAVATQVANDILSGLTVG
jgi:hypothetical protein